MNKKKIIIISAGVVVIAGITIWYIRHKKAIAAVQAPAGAAPAASATSPGGVAAAPQTVADMNRAMLRQRYEGQQKQIDAISAADPETLRRWALIVSIWNTPGGGKPYAIDLNGNPSTDYAGSVGSWWEAFSKKNAF